MNSKNDTIKSETPIDYKDVIEKIALEIEQLKSQYPQLIDFDYKIHLDIENLTISYKFKTHKSTQTAGWLAGVPEPDVDGIWFYIDFYSPDSNLQIHTQPIILPLCIGEKRVSFLIIEGQKTKSIQSEFLNILKKYKVIEC